MCLIILKPPKKTIAKSDLQDGFNANSDGAGFMYNDGDMLYMQKGFFDFAQFYKAFKKAETQNPDSCFAIHFRLATSGSKSTKMCHPFLINNTGIMHNGIIWDLSYKKHHKSDTSLFCEKIVAKLPKLWLSNKAILSLLEGYAKENCSKFVFMNADSYYIANESAGQWRNGCWFSNKRTIEKTKSFGFSKSENKINGVDSIATTYSHEFCENCGAFILPGENLYVLDGEILCCEFCSSLLKDGFYDFS